MTRRILDRLSYANVISTLCLFLVLGGGTAVALHGKNSVNSGDIINGEVTKDDLAAGLLATGKVRGVTDPASTPGTGITSMNVKLAGKARLFVTGRLRASTTCPPSTLCYQTLGLYVDGSPLSGSAINVGTGSVGLPEYTLFGLSQKLSKGSHEVTLAKTLHDSPTGTVDSDYELGTITLSG
jgi:hypothetical protein